MIYITYIHREKERERKRKRDRDRDRQRKRKRKRERGGGGGGGGGGRGREKERERFPSVVIFSSLMMSFLQKMQNRYTSVAFTCFCLSSFERL